MSDTKVSLMQSIKSHVNIWFNNQLKKRKHSETSITLTHKNIYILPSKFGMAYLISNVLVYVLGINYPNNFVIMFRYLMFSFLLVHFLVAFINLYNLKVSLSYTVAGYKTFVELMRNKSYHL